MKLRRSARTILSTLGILTVFTLITIWHNHRPDKLSLSEQNALRESLAEKNTSLSSFMDQLDLQQQASGFYVAGRLPVSAIHACYQDPIARQWISADGPVVRYRSVEDLLGILARVSRDHPGTLETLDLSHHELILETPLNPSLRLVVSIMLGLAGLMIIKRVNP